MALSCAEFRQRLDANERLDAPDVREHAKECLDCRRALERWQAAAGEMRAWSEEPAPPFLHTRIMAGLRGAAKAESHGRRAWFGLRPVWASSALAAAFVLVVASVVMLRAPQVTQAPASLGEARGRMQTAPSAGSEHAFAAGENERQKRVEQQRLPAAGLAREEEAPQVKRQPLESEPQPKQELDRGVSLSDKSRAWREEAPRRDEPRLRQAEMPRDTEKAAAPAAPAPQSQASGGTAGAPAPRAGSDAAVAEVKAIEPLTVSSASAPRRAAAEEPGASRAKAVVSLVRARLVPLAGGPARSVEVSPTLLAAGPRLIDVDEQGWPQVAAEPAKPGAGRGVSTNGRRDAARLSSELSDERSLAQDDLRAIKSLRLPPGRYRLERIEE